MQKLALNKLHDFSHQVALYMTNVALKLPFLFDHTNHSGVMSKWTKNLGCTLRHFSYPALMKKKLNCYRKQV